MIITNLLQESEVVINPSENMNVSCLYEYSDLSFTVQVVVFFPKLPSSALIHGYKNKYSLTATPEIDAGFYFDLAIRSLTAVHNMKLGGSWPEITYTKCSEYTAETAGDYPIDRVIDLESSLKVI